MGFKPQAPNFKVRHFIHFAMHPISHHTALLKPWVSQYQKKYIPPCLVCLAAYHQSNSQHFHVYFLLLVQHPAKHES